MGGLVFWQQRLIWYECGPQGAFWGFNCLDNIYFFHREREYYVVESLIYPSFLSPDNQQIPFVRKRHIHK